MHLASNLSSRLEKEALNYMQVGNIFHRLRSSDSVDQIYQIFNSIFEAEHLFTIKELINMAQRKNLGVEGFNLPEHYKLNSHIFKQNLVLITNIIIDDIWVQFNSLVASEQCEELTPKTKKSLFKIEEESQIIENCKTERFQSDEENQQMNITQIFEGAQILTEYADKENSDQQKLNQTKFKNQYMMSVKQLSPRLDQSNQLGDSSHKYMNGVFTPRNNQTSLQIQSHSSTQYLKHKNKSNEKTLNYQELMINANKSLQVPNKKQIDRKQNSSAEGRSKKKQQQGEVFSPRLTNNVNLKGLIQKMTSNPSFKK